MPAKNAAAAAERIGQAIDEALVLQAAHVALLVAAACGDVDLNALAREELANRGLGVDGQWVGFGRSGDTKRARPVSRPRPQGLHVVDRRCG